MIPFDERADSDVVQETGEFRAVDAPAVSEVLFSSTKTLSSIRISTAKRIIPAYICDYDELILNGIKKE